MLPDGAKVLVCVSGGADSIALLDVLYRAGYECVVAHCNFHLRGEESDRDEQFVRDIIPEIVVKRAYNRQPIPVYVKHFQTREYAVEQKKSIELAARELRYRWFAELAEETQCLAVAVAHHQNDQAETVIMNLKRGAGLKGLCGMWPKSPLPVRYEDGTVPLIPLIRPLLCTTHEYICYYLRDIRGLNWVEDSTNTDTRYTRNAVREMLKTWSKAEIEHVAKTASIVQEQVKAEKK